MVASQADGFAGLVAHALALTALLTTAVLQAHSGPEGTEHAPAEPLEPKIRVERSLGGGEKQYFQLQLEAGDLVQLKVEQHGTNVGVTLRDPAGETLFAGNSPNGAHGSEPLRAVAEMGGAHELEIWSLLPRAPAGKYVVELSPTRPATDEDRRLFEVRNQAWTQLEAGMTARSQATDAASLRNAIEFFLAAAPLWAEVGDFAQQARALNAAGLSFRQLGEPNRARELYQQALPLWRQTGNRAGEADQLNNLGRLAATLGDLEGASRTHEKALAIRREIADLRGVAESLGQIGATLRLVGELDRAYAALEEALSISQQLGNHWTEAHTRNNLGLVDHDRDRPQVAIEQFNAALKLFRQAKSRRYQALTLSNLGTVYQSIGDFERASGLFEESLEMN